MSVSCVSSVVQQPVPPAPKARQDDERTESKAVKAKEAAAHNDAAVHAKKSAHLDIKV